MKEWYVYILQVNIALIVFYLLYSVLFVRDTFLEVRRLFLMSAVLLAWGYPWISLDSWLQSELPVTFFVAKAAVLVDSAVAPSFPETGSFNWPELLLWSWGIGSLVLVIRLSGRIAALGRMAVRGERVCRNGQVLIVPEEEVVPFSFFRWIFVKPELYDESGLDTIITHERVHVRHWHSLDVLMGELLCVLLWFNPALWLLRKGIRQNLEFLADREVVKAGYNRRNYQYHLLHVACQGQGMPVVNSFNVSPLKKRIMMMNRKRTARLGLAKYALLIPVTGMLILSANAEVLIAKTGLSLAAPEELGAAPSRQEGRPVIKGKVVDEKGQPVQGVTVVILNGKEGTLTKADGTFELKGHQKATLSFSYVGKKTKVMELPAGMENIVVEMVDHPHQLEKVIVTGYVPAHKEMEIFEVVEEMPRFANGESPEKFIARTVRYPVRALEQGIEGEILVSFVVDKNGKVVQPKIVRGIHEDLDKEVLRIVKTMPGWIPGKQRGKAVAVQFNLPVEFRLEKKE